MQKLKIAITFLLGLFLPGIIFASDSEAAAGIFVGLFSLVFFLIYFIFIGGMFIVSILGTILWIVMLVDCAKREFKNENDKLVWILVIALTGWIGAVIYYFMIKQKDKKKVINKKKVVKKPAKKKTSKKSKK